MNTTETAVMILNMHIFFSKKDTKNITLYVYV